MVEILCGISAGSAYASRISEWSLENSRNEADLGHVFIAVDPNCFAPGFTDRMTDMNNLLRDLPAMDPSKPVLIAGDPERAHMKKVDEDGGFFYVENQIQSCNKLATMLNVEPMKYL